MYTKRVKHGRDLPIGWQRPLYCIYDFSVLTNLTSVVPLLCCIFTCVYKFTVRCMPLPVPSATQQNSSRGLRFKTVLRFSNGSSTSIDLALHFTIRFLGQDL